MICKSIIVAAIIISNFLVIAGYYSHFYNTKANSIYKLYDKKSSNDNNNSNTALNNKERLQKVLARAGVASRRAAELMISDGRVTVNGRIVSEAGVKVQPQNDAIAVDGKTITLPSSRDLIWIALHKPKDVLTTMADDKRRNTILSLVPKASDLRLVPVGRLERDTTGLLLLTNDVGWIHPLTHPSYKHVNRYIILVDGLPDEESVDQLCKGLLLPDESLPYQPSTITLLDSDRFTKQSLLDISIEETHPHQLQGMVEYLGCKLLSTKRVEYGPVRLRNLKRGEWRELTAREVDKLKASCIKRGSQSRNESTYAANTSYDQNSRNKKRHIGGSKSKINK